MTPLGRVLLVQPVKLAFVIVFVGTPVVETVKLPAVPTVNAVLPSIIDTPANRAAMPNADHDRWVRPAEIAGVISHLLSPDSGPVSGGMIPVYGRA